VPYDVNRFRLAAAHAQNSSTFQFWSNGYFSLNAATGISFHLQFEIWS
jgi:hypothetical protein